MTQTTDTLSERLEAGIVWNDGAKCGGPLLGPANALMTEAAAALRSTAKEVEAKDAALEAARAYCRSYLLDEHDGSGAVDDRHREATIDLFERLDIDDSGLRLRKAPAPADPA